MANSISIQVQLDGQDAINTIKGLEKGFKDLSKTTTTEVKKMDSAMSSFVGNLGAMAAVKAFDFLKDSLINSVDAFTKFEDGITGVAKTTNFSAAEVAKFSKNIEKMSKTIPASTDELLGIAEAAGQLGVKGVKNVSIFTETIAKLGRVSNLEGDVAATTLARVLNITGEGIETVGTLADVIVDLGNNFAASEAEIAAITSEVAKATAQFGVSSSEAAALGATLTSLGVRAEEAGGVMSKSFIAIDQTIRNGGKPLERLIQLTGLTGDQLKKTFEKDAIGVFKKFTEGLQRVGAEGGNVTAALGGLGIKGIRVSKVLPTLANNTELFADALGRAKTQVEEGGAVTAEYEQILDKTSTKMALFNNVVTELSREFFGSLAPAFNNVLDVTTAFLEKLSASSPLEEAQANAKGLAATIKDVGDTTKGVNSILPEFLAKINQSFADDRIKRMNDELKITEATVASLSKESTGLEKIEADITLAEDALKKLNAEIAEESISEKLFGKDEADSKKEQQQLTELTEKVRVLKEERIKELAVIKKSADAAAEAAARKAEIADEDTARTIAKEQEKRTFLDEIRAADKEREATELQEKQLARELQAEEEFAFLSKNLGREEAARQLHKARQIEDEGKRREALKKIGDKARAGEKKAEEERIKQDAEREKVKVQNRRAALRLVAGMTSSANVQLFEIGKAAAVVNAGISTAEAVTKTLASVPYPFNFAAAGLVGAAGAQQIAKIAGQKRPERSAGDFASGGIIGGNSPTGDNLTANVNSGEVIFNKRQQQNLFNAVDQGSLGGGGANITINNPMFLSEEGVDEVIDQINNRVEFGNKTLKASEVA